jgi:hypothetical protein
MRHLPKPLDNPLEVFLTCIASFTNYELRNRLIACSQIIIDASIEFDHHASNSTLHQIASHTHVNGNVTSAEMVKVYTQKMARKATPGRTLYNRLKAQPRHGRCPLCAQREVTTLDHHLNKADFPVLAVTPYNLVPSCQDCNKAKLAYHPNKSEEETLHPYYDKIENDLWLEAIVDETLTPAAVIYQVVKPEGWNDILYNRVKNHFNLFGLGNLYGSHAAEELDNLRLLLIRLYNIGGAAAVRDHLKERKMSAREVYINSWQSALYNALEVSDWYCNGGFK